MHVYDRIDLKPIGTWTKNFRPNGLVLNFGYDLDGGYWYDSLTNVELPFGAVIGSIVQPQTRFVNALMSQFFLPKDINGTGLMGVSQGTSGVTFRNTSSNSVSSTVFNQIKIPGGTFMPVGLENGNTGVIESKIYDVDTVLDGPIYITGGTYTMPYGCIVTGTVEGGSYKNITLSKLDPLVSSFGVLTTDGVTFSGNASLLNVFIPYGTNFTKAMIIGGDSFAIGVFQTDTVNAFQMQTTQLIDINGKAIFSVHDIDSGETVCFTRPTADIGRLVMYCKGIGVDSDPFACYSIVFKTTITAAQVVAFNKLHPSDLNPVIIDDGTLSNVNVIIPLA